MSSSETMGYRDAVERIEEIVDELDNDRLDIDHLSDMVREAAGLLHLCRERLGSTEAQVGLVLKEMSSLGADGEENTSSTEAAVLADEDDSSDELPF